MDRAPRRIGRLVAHTALALVPFAGSAAANSADSFAAHPAAAVRASTAPLMFHLKPMKPASVRSASLVVSRRSYRLPVRRVRAGVQRGTVAVRPPTPANGPVAGPVLVLKLRDGSSLPVRAAVSSGVVSGVVGSDLVASGVLTNPGCLPGYGSFGGGVTPPGCWRPYSPASPFNREIPPGVGQTADSAAVVARVLSFGALQNLRAGGSGEADSGRPLFYSSASDPVFVLHCTEAWGTCPLEGQQIHVPDQARAGGGYDAHLSILDQASGVEYDLWGVQSKPPGGGTLAFRWGGQTRIDGDGLGSAAVAAGYGAAAGVLRAEELASGHINHALFLAVHCDSGHYVYPANKAGSTCSDPTNAPPEGTRLQLTLTDTQIAALPVPTYKKTILTAMAHYGMIVGDTGGSWGIAQESGTVYTSYGQPDKWITLAQQNGATYYPPDHDYTLNLSNGIDWAQHLRVIPPCTSQGTC